MNMPGKICNRVLITGATGFIGSHVARRLVKEGWTVGIIKRPTSNLHKIVDILNRLIIFDADLSSSQEVQKAVFDFCPDVLIHLATQYTVNHKPDQISPMVVTNVLGTVNLLQAAQEKAVKLFVNTSSCFVYKPSEDKVSEDRLRQPINLYALTKMQAEDACAFYADTYGLPSVTLRIFSPYGPGDHERRLIPYIINSFSSGEAPKMTTGKQRWDFVYIHDIVEAYLKVLQRASFLNKHEIFNIGSGEAVSVRDIALKIKQIMRSHLMPQWGIIPHRDNELWHVCADIKKAKMDLGWTPQVRILNEGLAPTVEWFRENYSGNMTGVKNG